MATLGGGGGLRLVDGLLMVAVLGLLAMQLTSGGEQAGARPVPVASPLLAPARLEGAQRRIEEFERELDRMAGELALLRSLRREPVTLPSEDDVDAGNAELVNTPAWYLEQYVLSFQGGQTGSEYFRLAVEAYAPVMLSEITKVFLSRSQPRLLRQRLVEMLADMRFQGHWRAIDPLLGLLRAGGEDPLLLAAVRSLRSIGDAATGEAIESLLWGLDSTRVRTNAIQLVVHLAREDANLAIGRMLRAAPDAATQALLVKLLQTDDLDAGLEVFEFASTLEKDVRLAAANKVGGFRSEPFRQFVEDWIWREHDEQVLAALGAARARVNTVPGWHALQATGAPDADPNRDDPNAWAPRSANMGEQWLELTYETPRRANSVRIFEVNSAGAVTRVVGISLSSERHTLWEGEDPTVTAGVFEVSFPTTSFRVKRLLLILDTNRRNGWNEIDAVELVGPEGRAWASGATSSSSYGN